MLRARILPLFAFCAVLSACDGSTDSGHITAPAAGPPTVDDVASADDPSVQQVATGGHASGRFELASPTTTLASVEYSFNAQSTAFPLATGEMVMHVTFTNDVTLVVHSEVVCLAVVETTAFIGGTAKKVTINGETQPALEGLGVTWQVQDNGEGANDPPDLGSLVVLGPNPIQHCTQLLAQPMTPSASGNIEVRSD